MHISMPKLIFSGLAVCVMTLLGIKLRHQAKKAREPEFAQVCINNLRMLEAVKAQWAEKNQARAGDVLTEQNLLPLIPDRRMLKCPLGGIYHLGNVGETPTCSLGTTMIPAHSLR